MPTFDSTSAPKNELEHQAKQLIETYQNPYKSPSKQISKNKKTALIAVCSSCLLLGFGIGLGYLNSIQKANIQIEPVTATKPITSDVNDQRKKILAALKKRKAAQVKGASDSAKLKTFEYQPYKISFKYNHNEFEIIENFKTPENQPLDEDAHKRFEIEQNQQPPDLIYKLEVAEIPEEVEESLLNLDNKEENDDSQEEEIPKNIPFRIYVYNNLDDLSIEEWFDKYHYYPYEWGNDTAKLKPEIDLNKQDVVGKYTQEEDNKRVKYIYFSHEQKIYLVWMDDLKDINKRKIIGAMLASFSFDTEEEKEYTNDKYNFTTTLPKGDETFSIDGNKLHIKDNDEEIIRTFTIFDVNKYDSENLAQWWEHNIYTEVGGFVIPNDYNTQQDKNHPSLINRNAISPPTLVVSPKLTTTAVPIYTTSYYMYYNFGKPFVLHYVEETTEEPTSPSVDWPIITIKPATLDYLNDSE